MIRVEWKDPTFRVKLADRGDKVLEEVHSAPTEEALRSDIQARIDQGFIKSILSIVPYDFPTWRQGAVDSLTAVKQAFDTQRREALKKKEPFHFEYEFSAAIWRELKLYLIQLFNGKCAYCEANFRTVSYGDVEHYRPKGKVTDAANKTVTLPNGERHPGYYWLAYDYGNLMPACARCNQGEAKKNKFPIADGSTRAVSADDPLDAERPLLINPYDTSDDPRSHIRFATTKDGASLAGFVHALDAKGEASIDVYNLNRQELIEDRRAEQQDVANSLLMSLQRREGLKVRAEKQSYVRGRGQFSAAVVAEIEGIEADLGMTIPV